MAEESGWNIWTYHNSLSGFKYSRVGDEKYTDVWKWGPPSNGNLKLILHRDLMMKTTVWKTIKYQGPLRQSARTMMKMDRKMADAWINLEKKEWDLQVPKEQWMGAKPWKHPKGPPHEFSFLCANWSISLDGGPIFVSVHDFFLSWSMGVSENGDAFPWPVSQNDDSVIWLDLAMPYSQINPSWRFHASCWLLQRGLQSVKTVQLYKLQQFERWRNPIASPRVAGYQRRQ